MKINSNWFTDWLGEDVDPQNTQQKAFGAW